MAGEKYELLIEAQTESKAKILGIPAKSFVEGQKYTQTFLLTNLGKEPYPGGKLFIRTGWPSQQNVDSEYEIPEILPKESYRTLERVARVLSGGYGLIAVSDIGPEDAESVELFRNAEKPIFLDFDEAFHLVSGKAHEEIYEFWAMLIAASSLLIIALEKIVQLFLWISSILPSSN